MKKRNYRIEKNSIEFNWIKKIELKNENIWKNEKIELNRMNFKIEKWILKWKNEMAKNDYKNSKIQFNSIQFNSIQKFK